MTIKNMKHLQKAIELQNRAYSVIEDLEIRRRWESVGKTVLVGSVRFGLMSTPNIDFEVYVEDPDVRIGFDTIREFAAVPGVKQIQFLNFLGTSDPGLYWRINYQDEYGVIWDIDNWLVPFSHPHAGMADGFAKAMEKALTDEARQIILDIKSKRELEHNFRGIDIYKAVLSGGVRDMDGFIKWLAKHPLAEMEMWQPSV